MRDAIGHAADSFMDPFSYFVAPIFADLGRSTGYTINQRAANMTKYSDLEDTSLDLYAALRNGYLQRRQKSNDTPVAVNTCNPVTSLFKLDSIKTPGYAESRTAQTLLNGVGASARLVLRDEPPGVVDRF